MCAGTTRLPGEPAPRRARSRPVAVVGSGPDRVFRGSQSHVPASQSAGRENLDTGHVARYDLTEDAGAAEELALLQRLGLTRASVLVDIGAGTGLFGSRSSAGQPAYLLGKLPRWTSWL